MTAPNFPIPTSEGFAALRSAIERHPAEAANRRWMSIQTVHTCLMANEAELREVVGRAELHREYLHALLLNRDHEQEVFFANLFRTLHNYLAMMVTLVDHARAHMDFYAGTDFAKEQKQRNDDVRQRISGKLLRDLRNYMLHRSVPPMEFSAHWSKDSTDAEHVAVRLNAEQLLDWSNWSAESKRYLRSVETLNVGEIVADYSQAVSDYYRWFYEQYGVLHRDEIADRNRLVKQYERYWSE